MIDPKKTYRTRDGREVRIYAVDGGGEVPVHGAIKNRDCWTPTVWLPDGRWALSGGKLGQDLIEVSPRIKREVWVNVYRDNKCGAYTSREMADACCAMDRIACVKLVIDCEEGEGL